MTAPGRVTIVGFGLMGASLGRALKRLPVAPEVVATTREPGIARAAIADGAADAVRASEEAAVRGADVVVYATPVSATLALLEEHAALLRASGAVVTDVGSVKAPIVERARRLGLDRFVGGHPLCGAERSGYDAASAELYDDARVFLVPAPDPSATELVAALWRAAGATHIEPIDPALHDERMAWISHLPQLLSSCFAACLAGAGRARAELGPGGADVLRLAGSEPALWSDILRHNADALVPAVAELSRMLERAERALRDDDVAELEALLARARVWTLDQRP